MPLTVRLRQLFPGFGLCLSITAAAYALEGVQAHFAHRAWIEALVIALVLGTLIRSLRTLPVRFEAGIDFSAKPILEVAIVLLGFQISTQTIAEAGTHWLAGIALTVAVSILLSYLIGRGFGLSKKLALLIACGNSICGNSAIVATAPVIHADRKDVAASIAFTAILGVAVVLLLPLLTGVLRLNPTQFGVFAGLTVYAVPQVIAATAPVGAVSVQIGTLVKLVRVLMLGPIVLCISIFSRDGRSNGLPKLGRLVPPFILGFIALAAIRSAGYVPEAILPKTEIASRILTTVAMAALGLSVDIRTVGRSGPRITLAGVLSLLMLSGISLLLIDVLQIQ